MIIVTGSNCGIGYESALTLGLQGATVVMACRDMVRGEKARDSLNKKMNYKGKLELMQLDLSD